MKVIHTVNELKLEIELLKKQNKSIGLVPTMGFLHDGHLSLVKKSKEENNITVVSIFVNPTQFGANEDLQSYPRDLDKDASLLKKENVDLIFNPDVDEMYPSNYMTYVEVQGDITKKLCGKSRPGHFRGVTTIVSKLFNLVQPQKAYFGQKDAQQVAVIEQMVNDLDYNIEIVRCPIVREKDGLALSSRNTYLSKEERKSALILSKSLFKAQEEIDKGERDAKKLKKQIEDNIKTEENAFIDYIEIVDAKMLNEIDILKGKILIALAIRIGKTRLIDNICVEV